MEEFVTLLIPALLGVILVRLILLPLGLALKLGIHAAAGFFCLWLLNAIGPYTGILLPINLATVLIAGFLGLPGIGLVALLTVL